MLFVFSVCEFARQIFFELVTVSKHSFHTPEVTEKKKKIFSRSEITTKAKPSTNSNYAVFSIIYRSFCNSILLLWKTLHDILDA